MCIPEHQSAIINHLPLNDLGNTFRRFCWKCFFFMQENIFLSVYVTSQWISGQMAWASALMNTDQLLALWSSVMITWAPNKKIYQKWHDISLGCFYHFNWYKREISLYKINSSPNWLLHVSTGKKLQFVKSENPLYTSLTDANFTYTNVILNERERARKEERTESATEK